MRRIRWSQKDTYCMFSLIYGSYTDNIKTERDKAVWRKEGKELERVRGDCGKKVHDIFERKCLYEYMLIKVKENRSSQIFSHSPVSGLPTHCAEGGWPWPLPHGSQPSAYMAPLPRLDFSTLLIPALVIMMVTRLCF